MPIKMKFTFERFITLCAIESLIAMNILTMIPQMTLSFESTRERKKWEKLIKVCAFAISQ